MAQGRDDEGHLTCDPWRTRIESAGGIIRGAGILLDNRRVLTCTHVAAQESGGGPGSHSWVPASDLLVYLDEYPEIPAVAATVVGWGWQSAHPLHDGSAGPGSDGVGPGNDGQDDEIGDVAVLELATPVTGVPRPLLRRTWRREQAVRMFGFPGDVPLGEWASASVAGPASHRDRWVQLEVVSAAHVEEGFSGAAVTDQVTGDVIGMMVAVDKKDGGVTCWMVDVRAIRRYVPLAADLVIGSASVDPAFRDSTPVQPGDAVLTALTRALGDWLTSGGPGGVCVIEGGPASGRAAVFAGLVAFADQEFRGTASGKASHGAAQIPASAPGSIDVAVDATGKTPAEVSRQIGAGLSIPADDPDKLIRRLAEIGPPVGVVLDAVDAAAQPEALPRDLAEPLATAAERHGIRLLLGFHEEPPPALRGAVTARLPDLPADQAAPPASAGTPVEPTVAEIARRLNRLAELIDEAKGTEESARQRHEYVARRVRGVPRLQPSSGAALSIQMAVMRALEASQDPAERSSVIGWLDASERAAREALSRARDLVSKLDALMRRRDEQRGLFGAYAGLARDEGLSEDPVLGAYYAKARDRMLLAPSDLNAEERAISRYIREVRRRLGPMHEE